MADIAQRLEEWAASAATKADIPSMKAVMRIAAERIRELESRATDGQRAGVPEGLAVDAIMAKVQEFASTWALAGGRFDDGTAIDRAEECKAEIRAMLADAPTPPYGDAERDRRDAERYRQAIALEDNAEALYAAMLNNAGNVEAINTEFDAAIEASKGEKG